MHVSIGTFNVFATVCNKSTFSLNALEEWSDTQNHIIPRRFHNVVRRLFDSCPYVSFAVNRVDTCTEQMAKTVLATLNDEIFHIPLMWAKGTISPLVWEEENKTNIPLHLVHKVECELILRFPTSGTRWIVDERLLYMLKLIFTPTQWEAYRRVQEEVESFESVGNQRSYYYDSDILQSLSNSTDTYPHAVEPPPGLTVRLRPHQRRNLEFAMRVEDSNINPYWVCLGERSSTDRVSTRSGSSNHDTKSLFWNPYLKMFSLNKHGPIRGGMIADQMGLGKTITCLSIILKQRSKREHGNGGTLVVCPVSLVGQWYKEAIRRLGGSLRVYKYYGSSRKRDPEVLRSYDIIITTYGVVSSDVSFTHRYAFYNSTERPIPTLEQVTFQRVIFDESHAVKNTSTVVFRACKSLNAHHVWCVTGTPTPRYWTDIMAQMQLISDEYKILSNGNAHRAFIPLLQKRAVRHHKNMKIDGSAVLSLPECQDVSHVLHMNDEARELYETTRQNIADQIHRVSTPLEIMYRIQILRRLCSSGFTDEQVSAFQSLPADDRRGEAARQKLPGEICSICLDEFENPAICPCDHVFCAECISGVLGAAYANRCPLCRRDIQERNIRLLHNPVCISGHAQSVSPKIEKTMHLVQTSAPEDKFLIFTHFKSTVKRLMNLLETQGIMYRTLVGGMSMQQRERALSEFDSVASCKVFILTLRAAGVGINLTRANHVVLMETAFNHAVEDQAVGRAWRMGQERQVYVHRMIIEGTLEEKILTSRRNNQNMTRTGSLNTDLHSTHWGTSELRRLVQ